MRMRQGSVITILRLVIDTLGTVQEPFLFMFMSSEIGQHNT